MKKVYIHQSDCLFVDRMGLDNKLQVSATSLSAPEGFCTYKKSLDDESGEQFGKFITLLKVSGQRFKF